ncbi:cytochrome c oxidase assembly factor 8 isoform X1 [Brachyistius frenatus]|uniref:cytochrome c oxidase assembly factor 8 isoform X1 n=1 Tax=Brachyistius frenatus TaxID=100188 RepID=UPI0037E9BD5F
MAARRALTAAGRSTWRSLGPAVTLRVPLQLRRLSAAAAGRAAPTDTSAKRSTSRPAASITHDWIGPPNPLSNLRPIVYRVPENESELEARLRHLRQETEDWNHDFWTNQNITFSKEKETFIISHLKAKGLTGRDESGRRQSLNSEEMSMFYKSFLDKNRIRHANYNKSRQWYRRNFTITFLMARVALNSMWRTLSERHSSKKNSTPPT